MKVLTRILCVMLIAVLVLPSLNMAGVGNAAQPVSLTVDVGDLPFEHVFDEWMSVTPVDVELVGFEDEMRLVVEFVDVSKDTALYVDGTHIGDMGEGVSTLFVLMEEQDTLLSFDAPNGLKMSISVLSENTVECPLECVVYGETFADERGSYGFDLDLSYDGPHLLALDPVDPLTFFSVTEGSISRFSIVETPITEELPPGTGFVHISSATGNRFRAELSSLPMPEEEPAPDVLFGPLFVKRSQAKTNEYDYTFKASSGVSTMHVLSDGVSSASIYLNNIPVFLTNDFNQGVSRLSKAVTIAESNHLYVSLGSGPDSGLVVWIDAMEDSEEISVSQSANEPPVEIADNAMDLATEPMAAGSLNVESSTTGNMSVEAHPRVWTENVDVLDSLLHIPYPVETGVETTYGDGYRIETYADGSQKQYIPYPTYWDGEQWTEGSLSPVSYDYEAYSYAALENNFASYYTKGNASVGYLVENDGYQFYTSVDAIEQVNDGMVAAIELVQTTSAVIDGECVLYPDLFGGVLGVDLGLYPRADQVKDVYTLEDKPVFGADELAGDLRIETTMSFDSTRLSVVAEGETLRGGFSTYETIEFVDIDGDTRFHLPPAFAWDQLGSVTECAYVGSVSNGVLRLGIQVDEEWICDENREYPVIIDPAQVVSVIGDILSQTWIKNYSYHVLGNVRVPVGETLTIEPGTQIRFENYTSITIEGELIATGTATEPVVFGENYANGVWDGIYFNSDANVLSYCYVNNSRYGVRLYSSSGNSIYNNTILGREGYHLTYSGIYLSSSSGNQIADNIVHMNNLDPPTVNGYSRGIMVAGSSSNTIANNIVEGGTFAGIHLSGSTGNIVSNNSCQDTYRALTLYGSSNNMVSGNQVWGSNYGVLLYGSCVNNVIIDNMAEADLVGLCLSQHSNDNTLTDNIANQNVLEGIGIYFSSTRNTLTDNTVSDNPTGVWNAFSSNNRFYHNNFINNTIQLSEDAANHWDNGYPSGGNYWSDYTGADNGSNNRTPDDGIGDTDIPHLGKDNYPFIYTDGWLGIPIAEAGSDIAVALHETFTLNGSNSWDNEQIVNYMWDLDASDGLDWTTPDKQGTTGTHAYTFVKDMHLLIESYEVTLRVEDNEGNVDYDTLIIEVTTGDLDGDGLPNLWEIEYGLDLLDATDPYGADGDPDMDNLTNMEELLLGTHPNNLDTDGDGLLDGEEVQTYYTSPLTVDADVDNFWDGAEIAYWGIVWELGIIDVRERMRDTDFDNDGLSDGGEIIYGTNPCDPDTDDDLFLDGAEVGYWIGRGLSQADISLYLNTPDSDGDTVFDGWEIEWSLDPLDPSDGNLIPRGNTGFLPFYYYFGQENNVDACFSPRVNSANGNLYFSQTDISFHGKHFEIEFTRAYNSQCKDVDSPLSNGWTFNYNIVLTPQIDLSVKKEGGDGDVVVFTRTLTDKYQSPPGYSETLYKVAGGFNLNKKNGDTYSFSDSGRLNKISDKNGNELAFVYIGGLLTAVHDDVGQTLHIFHNMDKQISRVRDPSGREVYYNYDSDGDLEEVILPSGHTIQFTYDQDALLDHVINPAGSIYEIGYCSAGVSDIDKVEIIKETAKDIYGISQTFTLNTFEYAPLITTATDTYGHYSTIEYNMVGNPVSGQRIGPCFPLRTNVAWVWDEDMNIVTTTDGLGGTHTYQYDSHDNLVQKRDSLSQITGYSWDTIDTRNKYLATLTSMTDPLGNIEQYEYDTDGNLIRETDPFLNQQIHVYDTDGNLISRQNKRGDITTFTYSPKDRIIRATDDVGTQFEVAYDTIGRVVLYKDGNGHETQYSYSAWDNADAVIDPLGNTIEYIYDGCGNPISITGKNGGITTFDIDHRVNKVGRITDALGNSELYSYDLLGNTLSHSDKNTQITQHYYDEFCRRIKTVNPIGDEELYSYSLNGDLLSFIDKNGHVTTYEYDLLGRRTQLIDAIGNSESHSYDANDQLIATTDKLGNPISNVYDGLGRKIEHIDRLGNHRYWAYDEEGNVITTTDALSHSVDYVYDSRNNQVETKETVLTGNGNEVATTIYGYDGENNLVSLTNPNGETINYAYDPLNQRTTMTDPLGFDTQYSYDPHGNIIALVDANSHTTNYAYDLVDRLTSITSPLGYTTTFQYDAEGNKISSTDANGATTTKIYDSINRLTKTDYPDGSYDTFDYDANGNTVALDRYFDGQHGGISQTFDSLNRLVDVTVDYCDLFTKTISYIYDAEGNRLQASDGEGGITSSLYDPDGRVIQITSPLGEITSFSYDAEGKITELRYSNGVSSFYTYGPAGRPSQIKTTDSGSNLIEQYDYIHDKIGHITTNTISSSGIQIDYSYDSNDRLISAQEPGKTVSYTYDGVGNILSKTENVATVTYTYDIEDRLLSTSAGLSFTYDNNGNLLSKASGADTTAFEYDYENQLTKIILPNTDEIEYNYCSFGKRMCRIDPTGATFYFYDKEDIITEYDATGTPIKEYLHGPGIDNPISVRTSGQSYFLHKDHLGSIGFITDSAESLIETYDYDEYGAYNGPSNPKSDYLFTGREYEEMAGIYYYRARYYDPEVGRFIQQDPRGLFSGRSLYEYSDSNPVNRIDPYGEATQQTCRAQQEGCVLVANTVQGTCLIGCAGTSFGIGLVVGAVITGPPGWVAGLIGGAVTIGTALACEDACFDIYTANLQTCEDAYDTCMNNAGQVAWNSQPLYNMWKPYHNIEPANPPTRTYTPSGFIMNCYYQGNFRACYIMI